MSSRCLPPWHACQGIVPYWSPICARLVETADRSKSACRYGSRGLRIACAINLRHHDQNQACNAHLSWAAQRMQGLQANLRGLQVCTQRASTADRWLRQLSSQFVSYSGRQLKCQAPQPHLVGLLSELYRWHARPGGSQAASARSQRHQERCARAPSSTRKGTSAASQGVRPRHRACAKPKCGLLMHRASSGLLLTATLPEQLRDRPVLGPQRLEVHREADGAACRASCQRLTLACLMLLPAGPSPLYILAVLPSSSGILNSGETAG